jgi:hypothetical protein
MDALRWGFFVKICVTMTLLAAATVILYRKRSPQGNNAGFFFVNGLGWHPKAPNLG